ncbi:MAG TPA: peptidoglycan DD-metalloendopeptidase family protein [Hymenobacter sp.]|jgi:murein DD-endopeptidase MepM/ murein hydrolase activator NlpD
MKKSIRILAATAFCALPWAAQAQRAQAVFYQQDRLYAATANGQPKLLGKQLAAKAGRLAVTSTVALYPEQIDASLAVPAGMDFFQGLQSPHQPEWVYLERAQIGTAYNLWLYNATTRRKQLLFNQPDSPVAGYALKPIAWSADEHVLYLEALKFDTDREHEGVWSFDLRTRQVQRLMLASQYFSTPVLSPDRRQFLYAVSTSSERDLLHGFADEVAVYDLATATETVVAQQKNVPHSVAGWAVDPADASAKDAPAAPAARTSAIGYRLPWTANVQYYVSRHGTPAPTGSHTPTGSRSTIYDGISQHTYAGIDFDTPNNADDFVRASAPGTVTSAGYCGDDCGYGNLVVIRHSDGTRTYYGHNKSVRVKVGETVQTGTILGIEGTTGRSSGDHIHFEWRAAGGNSATIGTFSDVGQPRQGWKYLSTTPNGDVPPPVPPTPVDTTVPTTSIATADGSTTQSADFTVNFTDADNVDVVERFYQPLEYYAATSEWRANRGNGFYNDNFGTGALHKDYTVGLEDWQGQWSVTTEGRLKQSDLVPTNTALSTFLSQTSGNTYLYHFAAKLLGDATTQTGRFGLHIMASSVTVRERGNSYLIWFSNNDQKVRILETIDNVLTERASADATIIAGEFADYKVSYSTTTGEIRVYLNNRLLLTWTDTTPLTSGSYLSLRTNQAQVEFDDLKVYKGRGTSRTVTVGTALSKDLRQASASSTAPAGKIKSLVRDAANNWSAAGNLDLIINQPAAAAAQTVAAELRAELYPNPIGTKSTLAYELPSTGPVTVTVLSERGKKVLTLLNDDSQAAGAHELSLTPVAELRPGTYYVRIQAGKLSKVHRVVKK